MSPSDHALTIRVGKLDRHYTVHVPPGYDSRAPVPVVVMLHGGGGTGKGAATETGWGAKADEAGFLAVFPDAMPTDPTKPSSFARNPQLWNDGSERFYAGQNRVDDVGFLNAMLDDLSTRFAVDAQRVFVAGFSNGASMTFRVGAELSKRVAAIAPAAGAYWAEAPALERPVSMCYITGTEDPLNLIEGGVPRLATGASDKVRAKAKPPVRDSIRKWAKALGCPAKPKGTSEANGVRTEVYGPGRDGAEVIYVTVEGLGHTWAGGKSLLPESFVGKTSDKLKTTDFIWDFFQKHSRGHGAPGERIVAQAPSSRRAGVVADAMAHGATLQLTSGPITGEVKEGVSVYRGIPYAAPPVGERRWKEPVAPEPWTQPRACVKYGPSCPQTANKMVGDVGEQSEDCLYLNVWTAAKASEVGAHGRAPLPVMVWIHGGGFYMGSGSQPVFDGTQMAKRGVVLVTINYRVGPFGFFAHPLLTAESPNKASGNYGLMDQIFALKWVQQNIAQFGGDPNNVTIFGESAGAVSVCCLMTSPLAKGIFHRVIAESGAAPGRLKLRAQAAGLLQSAEASGVEYAKRLGIEDTPDALKTLRAKSAQELLGAVGSISGLAGAGVLEYLIVDGYVLPEPPVKVLAEGRQMNVPLIIGTNADEGTLFARRVGVDTLEKYNAFLQKTFRGLSDRVLKYYPATDDASAHKAFTDFLGDGFVYGARSTARRMAPIQPKTFLYQFARTPSWAEQAGLGCFHGSEIAYVFNNLREGRYTEDDRKLSEAMMGYWTRFARTGDPNGDGAPQWPAYTAAADQHLILDTSIKTGQGLRKQTCDWLDALQRWRAQ